MRAAFLSTLLLVAYSVCAAQNTVTINSTVISLGDNQSNGANAATPLAPSSTTTTRTLTLPRADMLPLKTCYTMRSYLFSAATNGQAPRPVGYTTCTPSNALKMKQARQPRAKLLPQ